MPIDVQQLTVKRLGRTVLDNVTLRIDDGDTVSIIGPNGAGKSTLMSAMLGLLPSVGGTTLLDGDPITRLPRRRIAQRIAYVPQLQDGYLGFRVHDVIAAARYAYHGPLESLTADDRQAINSAIAATSLQALLDRTVDTLSGGERQKVWIAAALAQQSSMLFLDEPTSALDPAHQAELIRIIRDAGGNGTTLVVICHDLNLPLILGGKVAALRDGKLLFFESHETLKDTSRLEEVFGTSFTLHRQPNGDAVSIHVDVSE